MILNELSINQLILGTYCSGTGMKEARTCAYPGSIVSAHKRTWAPGKFSTETSRLLLPCLPASLNRANKNQKIVSAQPPKKFNGQLD